MTLIAIWAIVATFGWVLATTANHTLARRLEQAEADNEHLFNKIVGKP